MNGEGGESAHNSLSVTKVTELSVSSTAPTLSSSLLERLFPFSQLPLCLWRSHDTVLANQMQAAPPSPGASGSDFPQTEGETT